MKKILLAILLGTFLLAGKGSAATVVSYTPTNYATGVPPASSLTLVFSTGMRTNTVRIDAMNDSAMPPTLINGPVTWSADWVTAAFTPAGGFPAGAMIYWAVSGKDTNGVALSGDSLAGLFWTGAGGSNAPTVTQTSPANGTTNVGLSAPLIISFSQGMNTNSTSVKVVPETNLLASLPLTTIWSADQTTLTNWPVTPWPAGTILAWTASGAGTNGVSLSTTTGYFGTTNGSSISPGSGPGIIVLSAGTNTEQSVDGEIEDINPETVALSTVDGTLCVTPPGVTNALSTDGTTLSEWSETETNSITGAYEVQIETTTNSEMGAIVLNSPTGTQTPGLNITSAEAYVIFGQGFQLAWNGDASWDYVLVRLFQSGQVIYESPGPMQTGALTGGNSQFNVPASAITNFGPASVEITGFKFHNIDAKTIPGVQLVSAEHSRLARDLRIVPGWIPGPSILSTNISYVPAGEPVLMILWATNGVGPFTWQLAGGTLPSGLAIDPMGAITGTTTNLQTNTVSLSVTDLLGRKTTTAVTVTTVPVENGAAQPTITHPKPWGTGGLAFSLGGSPGTNYEIMSSPDLLNWALLMSTNLPKTNVVVAVSRNGSTGFYQARAFDPLRRNPPAALTLVPDQSGTAAVIDQSGGALLLTNATGHVFTLTIPVGALQSPQTITMTNLSQLQGLPLDGGLGAAVALGPEGLLFSEPVELDISYPGTIPTGTIAFGTSGDGRNYGWHVSTVTNNIITQFLWHFSSAGSGAASSANAASAAQTSPADTPSSLDNQLASALAQFQQEGNQVDAVASIFIQAGLQDVIPICQAAVADDSQIEAAIYAYVTWARAAELLLPDVGLTDYFGTHPLTITEQRLQGILTRAMSLINQAAVKGMNKAFQDCMAHNLKRELRIFDLGRILALLNGSGDGTPDYGAQAFAYIKKCMKFTVEIDSTVTYYSNPMFTAHTRAKVKLHPFSNGESSDDILMIGRGFYNGAGTWIIDEVVPPPPATWKTSCVLIAKPANGKVKLDFVKMSLYQKVITSTSKGWVVDYVPNPSLSIYWSAVLACRPQENRTVICPAVPPEIETSVYNAGFEQAHKSEEYENTQADFLPDDIYWLMTDFTFGGDGNSEVFQKTYNNSLGNGIEITTVNVYHTP